MTRIEWGAIAVEDRSRAFDAAMLLGPDYAEMLLDQLGDAERFLARTPFAGTPVFDSRRRKWRLGTLPLGLIYRVEGDRLFVLRLIDLRSDWTSQP